MDRKSIIILVACFVLLILWVPLLNRVFPPKPAPAPTNLVARAPSPGATPSNAVAAAPPPSLPPAISAPSGPPISLVRPEGPEELVVMETADLRLTFTSHGGGLKQVELKKYPESVNARGKALAATNRWAALNLKAPVPALAVLGGGPWQDNLPYQLQVTGGVLRAVKTLPGGLRVSKEIRPGTNYVLLADLRVENTSAEAVALPGHELVIGTATPIHARDAGQFLGVQWYNGDKAQFIGQSWFANRTLGCLPGTPRTEYQMPEGNRVVWAAVHNQFFTMIAAPTGSVEKLVAREVGLPLPSAAERAADRKVVAKPVGYQAALVYPAMLLGPGQATERHLTFFVGPKEYNTLAKLGNNLDLAMNFSSFFGWFAKALLLSMNGLHKMGLSYGLAIIAITVVVKLVFWPLTAASTRSMKRMQALQPQMKALQEKYKDDPQKMNAKLMEFMKENKVSPLGSCLPMVIQIPVFIGFYQMLQSAIELRGARFLWAHDLSQPDTVVEIFGFPVNPLPLVMGITQFWQARLTPTSPGVDPMQQKLMQYMPLIFIFILYSFPAGLALYWTVQTLLSILQMKLTKATSGAAAGAPASAAAPAPRKKSH
jgi:YidC/Oxa1 family membrane protein insertase